MNGVNVINCMCAPQVTTNVFPNGVRSNGNKHCQTRCEVIEKR
jgi:hypothetical protein